MMAPSTMETLAAGLLVIVAISLQSAEACHPAFIDAILPNQDMRCDIRPPAEHEGPACRMATEPDFYFDRETKTCVNAPWSECMPRGEGKGFPSLQLCEDSCPVKSQVVHKVQKRSQNPICKLPQAPNDDGPRCMAYIERFYYNSESAKCEQFIYGGCRGNENNFESIEDCEEACVDDDETEEQVASLTLEEEPAVEQTLEQRSATCQLPKKVGRCKAAFRRYYFNAEKGRCVKFIYGGCEGNANNFKSLQACKQSCPDTA